MMLNQVTEPLVAYVRSSRIASDDLSALNLRDPFLMHQISERGIPYPVFQEMQEAGPLHLQEWADILGVSSKTLTRYRQEQKSFSEDLSAVILGMTEIIELGMDVFGSSRVLRRWMKQESFALGGRSPLSLLRNGFGRQLVLRELNHVDHGIFA